MTPRTVTRQAPLSTGFSRGEYWSRLPFLFPGDLPDSRIELGSPALQADSLLLRHQESASSHTHVHTSTHTHIHACTHIHVCTDIYINTCICTYTCMHAHMCMHIYTSMCIYMNTHVHMHTYAHTHLCTNTQTCAHIHICIYTYIHVYTHTYNTPVYTHIHVYIHICICVCIYLSLTSFPTFGIYPSFHGVDAFSEFLCQPSSLRSDSFRNKSLEKADDISMLTALSSGSSLSSVSTLHKDLQSRLSFKPGLDLKALRVPGERSHNPDPGKHRLCRTKGLGVSNTGKNRCFRMLPSGLPVNAQLPPGITAPQSWLVPWGGSLKMGLGLSIFTESQKTREASVWT